MCSFFVEEKQTVKYVNESPLMKKNVIAKKFEIPTSTFATILESGLRANCERLKLCEYTDVEECVLKRLK